MKGKLSFAQQVLIFLALLLIVCAAFYFFAWSPQSKQLASIEKQRVEEAKKTENAKNTLSRLEAVKKAAPRIEAKIVKLGQKMPNSPELPTFLIQLQNISNDTGVDIISVKPGEPRAQAGGYSQVDFTLSFTGRYGQMNDFLYRLENMQRAVRISTVSLSYDRSLSPALNGTMTLSIFVLDSAPAAAVPKTAPQSPAPGQTAPAGTVKT